MFARLFVSVYVHAASLEAANTHAAAVINAYRANLKYFMVNCLSLYRAPFSRSHSAGQAGSGSPSL